MSATNQSGTSGIPLWAKRMRESRERVGLTQRQLGEAVGKSQQTINGYEHGRKPDIPTFRRIAAACGVPEAWLVPSEDIVSQPGDLIGSNPGRDQPVAEVVSDIDEDSALFAWTINRVRVSFEEEGIHPNSRYLFGYTKKLLRLVQGEPDDVKAKEAILRAIELERQELRRQLKILMDRLL
jgi:transcriptional regulator with XRE-family HTH domain